MPNGVAVDASGNVYVSDYGNSTVRKITPDGVVTTLAGNPGTYDSVDGNGAAAHFWLMYGPGVDGSGNVYVAEQGFHTIKKITPAGLVTTFAGSKGSNGSADGIGTAARFWVPRGVAADRSGNVYVSDAANHTIRKITPEGEVTTFAGKAGVQGSADGAKAAARFGFPQGISVDASGNVYVADTGLDTIRKITPDGLVTTLAGTPGSGHCH